jgi:hypothetical protein
MDNYFRCVTILSTRDDGVGPGRHIVKNVGQLFEVRFDMLPDTRRHVNVSPCVFKSHETPIVGKVRYSTARQTAGRSTNRLGA